MSYNSQYCGIRYCFYFEKSLREELTHSVCSRTRSGLRLSCVQTGPGLWQRKLDLDHRETPAVLRGRAPVLRCLRHTVLQHHGTTVGAEHETHLNSQDYRYFYAVRIGPFRWLYLWVGAAELRIYVFKRLDGGQVQSFSDFSVTSEAEVSSSLDGHGHQICPGEP